MTSMEEELTETKRLLNSEMTKSNGFQQMVEQLKKNVLNQAVVSDHHTSHQVPYSIRWSDS